ncbi:MAG: molecular chaperone TorD family protein [Burkholderiales bacterium]|nr:molecular chaperone TorD family protein [Burkholderiales bacterium]
MEIPIDEPVDLRTDHETGLLRAEVSMFFSDFFGNGRTAELGAKWTRISSIIWILASITGVEESALTIRKVPDLELGNALEAEFAKMFYGIGNSTIPLLESSWWNEEQLVCQDANRRATKFYADHGFSMKEGLEWQADHLSVELAFMAKLLGELPDSNEELKKFFKTHVKNFALLFAQRAMEHPSANLTKPVLEAFVLYIKLEDRLQTSPTPIT